jgi:SAM-dependent methyltransferase
MTPKLSIVICTYNRAELLADVLADLARQTADRADFEVLVVDNNSADETGAVVRRFAGEGIQYHLETRQGLSHARNRGWQSARGRYVAYLDDDVEVPADWVAAALGVIASVAPAAFGGPHGAFYKTPKPRWYKDDYASAGYGETARPLGRHEYLSGMNLVFRKDILARLGGFDPRLGMSGETIAYGEETAVLRTIRDEMPDEIVYYDPAVWVRHLVRAEKMTIPCILRQRFAGGRYTHRVFYGRVGEDVTGLDLLRRAARATTALAADLARALLARDQAAYPYVRNYLYERAFPHIATLGALYEQYRDLRRRPGPRRARAERGVRHDGSRRRIRPGPGPLTGGTPRERTIYNRAAKGPGKEAERMMRIPKWLADAGLAVNRLYYKQLFDRMYVRTKPHPSWFDHRIDLYYHWPESLFWIERGVFPRRHMSPGCRVLDLFCGDTFFARFFYSTIAGQVDAVDKDPAAIEHGNRLYPCANLQRYVLDAIRDPFPQERYDVVVWFEALDHIEEHEYRTVIEKIKRAIGRDGVLTGSLGIIPPEKQGKAHWEHKNEFATVEDLAGFLHRDFEHVDIKTTLHREKCGYDRRTAYFTARGPKPYERTAGASDASRRTREDVDARPPDEAPQELVHSAAGSGDDHANR